MKITKMVRLVTALSLITVSALGIHNAIKARENCEKLQTKYDALKESVSELRATVNTLAEQIKTQRAKLDAAIEQAKECAATDFENETEVSDDKDTKQNSREFYIVREYKGIIGVFDGAGKLIREENVAVAVLPAPDRQDLEIGIRVESEDELNELLENFE